MLANRVTPAIEQRFECLKSGHWPSSDCEADSGGRVLSQGPAILDSQTAGDYKRVVHCSWPLVRGGTATAEADFRLGGRRVPIRDGTHRSGCSSPQPVRVNVNCAHRDTAE